MQNRIYSSQFMVVFSLTSTLILLVTNFANSSQTTVWINPTVKEIIYKEDHLPLLKILPSKKQIQDCDSLLATINSGVDLNETREQKEFNSYWKCLVRAILDHGVAPSKSRFNLSQAGKQIFQHLDLASVRSSLAPRRPNKHYYLRDFTFALKHISATSLSLSTTLKKEDGFYYNFKILATGDFLHDGMLDLLVAFNDDAILRTYNSFQILILSWSYNSKSIIAVDAVSFLQELEKKR